MDDESGGHNKLESILHNQRFNLQSLSLKKLREITNDFSDERLLGQGGFGRVYKGVLENGNTIAVKKLTWTMSGLQDKQYENEARHLMRLKHPNIVQLVGCCTETEKELVMHNGKYVDVEKPEWLLCLEYLPNGSLCKYLSDASSGLDWDTRYKIIIGICYGLHYLHEEWQAGTPIIHRDLKPANILLDDNMVPKIADFGLSRLFGELQTRTITENQHGTLGYMSPEYLHEGIITKKLDIFSLGVIIIEIITGDKHYPYNVETSSEEFIDLVLTNWKNRLRKVQDYTSQEFYCQQIRRCIEIGLLCVEHDWAKRPTTRQIIERFAWGGAECSNKREVIKVTKKRSRTEGIRVQHYPPSRRLRVKEHDRKWWERPWPEDKFRSVLQMSRATFDAICEELGAVAKEETVQCAVVRMRVAVCIWLLATGEPLRLVSKRFGLGISTCHELVLEVCAAIKAVLMPKAVQWPDAPADVAAQFEAASGIANVVGAMYTTHIPIIAPKANAAAYYNRRHTERNQKTSYSITVQGIVDDAGAFTDVCIGWPGSMSDADVLERSALYAQRGAAGRLQGQWVVGGAGYPLMDWLLVPYTHQNMTWAQQVFNERVDGVRAVARDAFQRLKARWGCLQKCTEVNLQDLPVVLGACCVLHNICERAGDAVDPDNAFQIFDDDMVAENPVRSQAAVTARDEIAQNLLHRHSSALFK